MNCRFPLLMLVGSFALLSICVGEDKPTLTPADVEFFEKRIRPVLVDKCYGCHSAEAKKVQGGLMLDNRAAIGRGGDSGPAIKPGDAQASRLVSALRYDNEDLQMPPDGQLSDDVIADFERWVMIGAPDPRDGPAPLAADSIYARAAKHWAFLLPSKQQPPAIEKDDWATTDIDRFVLARLEGNELVPSPIADARTLVCRLHMDLTGLPPTFQDVKEFAADPSPKAYEQLVDKLLDSEHFGERWARHWLDLARFGDTKGYVFTADRNYPHAYKFRDWVIKALNDDMPYDRFLQLQIAADHLVDEESREHLAAMGFLTLGRRFLNNVHDLIDDRIDVVFRGTMGMTVSCARCHDHKYDPLSQQDYYGAYGIFFSSEERQDDGLPLRLVDKQKPTNVRVFLRGRHDNRGDVAPRQFIAFFRKEGAKPFESGSGRRELAEAIASRDNPLTARVFVNRVWGHLFGEGLVRTPSDFGLRSDPPTQQDVLDHLAVTFMDDAWSIKRLIRGIVLSSVYKQESTIRADAVASDAENLFLWRANRRRLDFEAMRDSLLAVSGKLDRTVGGESVQITGNQPSNRRTLYAFIDRQNLPGLFRTFDFASPDTHTPKRPTTTVPQQALYLLNSRFVQNVAQAVVMRIAAEPDHESKVGSLYRMVFAREPTSEELAFGVEFVSTADEDNNTDALANETKLLSKWERYAQTLLLTNEFLFLD